MPFLFIRCIFHFQNCNKPISLCATALHSNASPKALTIILYSCSPSAWSRLLVAFYSATLRRGSKTNILISCRHFIDQRIHCKPGANCSTETTTKKIHSIGCQKERICLFKHKNAKQNSFRSLKLKLCFNFHALQLCVIHLRFVIKFSYHILRWRAKYLKKLTLLWKRNLNEWTRKEEKVNSVWSNCVSGDLWLHERKIPLKIEYCRWVYDDFRIALFVSFLVNILCNNFGSCHQKIDNDTIPNDGHANAVSSKNTHTLFPSHFNVIFTTFPFIHEFHRFLFYRTIFKPFNYSNAI